MIIAGRECPGDGLFLRDGVALSDGTATSEE